jgi:DNA invertase Pin-like site-specific DNA recombinase
MVGGVPLFHLLVIALKLHAHADTVLPHPTDHGRQHGGKACRIDDALREAGCDPVFIDEGVSGMKASRPELDKAIAYLRKDDVLVITRLDRLGRSVANLVQLLEKLRTEGVQLIVTEQGIDTTTTYGKLLFNIVDLMLERTKDGLAAARARGRMGGRKVSYTPLQARTARTMKATGEHTAEEIGRTLGVSRPTVYRMLQDA